MTVHGGDAHIVADDLGVEPSDLLDFSANVNPRGLPPCAMERLRAVSHPRVLGLYPDPSARRLREALGKRLALPPDTIVVGPGAEALLAPIVRSVRGRRALVPVPAFSEYRRICAREGIQYVPFALGRSDCFRLPADRFCRSIESEAIDLVVLSNPHNPSGFALETNEVRLVVDAVAARRGTLLLDEAFIDYAPQASLATEAATRSNLIVVRSLTKFYGCPALRVGYAVAPPETIRRIGSFLPTWAVTQLATEALAEAVTDHEYEKSSLVENAIERERFRRSLAALGLAVLPSAANYLLLELNDGMPAAAELRTRLIQRHYILVRNCDSYEGLSPGRYIRVAVRTAEENARLVHALKEELEAR